MSKCPALFIQENSIYKTLEGFDCYDIRRDALSYKERLPAILHPPCRLWSRLRKSSTAPLWERWLAVWAVIYVRKYGGIVEHPAGSAIFGFMNIPTDGSRDDFHGYLISVDQHWFGHKARKRTYLYVCGIERYQIPSCPLRFTPVEYSVSNAKGKKEVTKYERNATPLLFALWLRQIQTIILENKRRLPDSFFPTLLILVYLQVDISTIF